MAEFIHPLDAQEHGYYGTLPHDEDPEAHTVAGVTAEAAVAESDQAADDEPKPAVKKTSPRPAAKSSE